MPHASDFHPNLGVKQYRKKPVEIQAVCYDGSAGSARAVIEFAFQAGARHSFDGTESVVIPTLEGDMTVSSGDYVIRGVQGEFYPCKPDIFAATYEEVV